MKPCSSPRLPHDRNLVRRWIDFGDQKRSGAVTYHLKHYNTEIDNAGLGSVFLELGYIAGVLF